MFRLAALSINWAGMSDFHYMKEYLRVSGKTSSESDLRLFGELVEHCKNQLAGAPSIPGIKQVLVNCGFVYDYFTFLADEVLSGRKGNCLGLPHLIVSIGHELGIEAKLRTIVAPHDTVFEDECWIVGELHKDTRYDNPSLAEKPEPSRWHRCASLEHMVIDCNGVLCDTTPGEIDTVPEYEAGHSMDFNVSLGCVFQDRAIMRSRVRDYAEAERLCQEALKINKDNREVYGHLAILASERFDDELHQVCRGNYLRIGADDSLALFSRSLIWEEDDCLASAIDRYPAYAEALARKATLMMPHDPGEARVLYAIASQLESRSAVLELPCFYREHFRELGKLFDRVRVAEILFNLQNESDTWGIFEYHVAVYELTGDRVHRAEAEESLQTPLQRLKMLRAMSENKIDISTQLNAMTEEYNSSRLFSLAVRQLWGKAG